MGQIGAGIDIQGFPGAAGRIQYDYDIVLIATAPAPVPEPGTIVLFGLGLAALGFSRKEKA